MEPDRGVLELSPLLAARVKSVVNTRTSGVLSERGREARDDPAKGGALVFGLSTLVFGYDTPAKGGVGEGLCPLPPDFGLWALDFSLWVRQADLSV